MTAVNITPEHSPYAIASRVNPCPIRRGEPCSSALKTGRSMRHKDRQHIPYCGCEVTSSDVKCKHNRCNHRYGSVYRVHTHYAEGQSHAEKRKRNCRV